MKPFSLALTFLTLLNEVCLAQDRPEESRLLNNRPYIRIHAGGHGLQPLGCTSTSSWRAYVYHKWTQDGTNFNQISVRVDSWPSYYFWPAEGEIVPFGGACFEVELPGNDVLLKRRDPKTLPPGIAIRADSVVLPLNPRPRIQGTFGWETWINGLNKVGVTVAIEKGADGKPVATATVLEIEGDLHKAPDRNNWRSASNTSRVRTGDVLIIAQRGFRVRNIVPHDPKTRVYGWLELDPEQTPLEELKKRGTPYVEPTHRPGAAEVPASPK